MKNIREMEILLCDMLEQVKNDPRRCPQAKEVANVCGKLLNTQKISMEYAAMNKTTVILPFMDRTNVDGEK